MIIYKQYDSGLQLIVKKMNGLMSVSAGVFVKCGSANESAEENGISHFIEHTTFKGTKTRTAFDISDEIDRFGAQINAYTSKETTCYYVKSTSEHFNSALNVLSDIFFNSEYAEEELDKERDVILQEIAMTNDSPEDLTLDKLSESYYGNSGYGAQILGTEENVKRFNRDDIKKYMDKYYVPKNVVISIAGNVDLDNIEKTVKELFEDRFTRFGAENLYIPDGESKKGNINIVKDVEQSHVAIAMPTCNISSPRVNAVNIITAVFGGGMSSRLYQTVRENLGLAYSVYSYASLYMKAGTLCVYAGVANAKRDVAFGAIVDEIKKVRDNGLTEKEFLSGKEQVKSSLIMSQESTSTQMQLYGLNLLRKGDVFNLERKIIDINELDLYDVNRVVKSNFDLEKASVVSVGKNKKELKIQ